MKLKELYEQEERSVLSVKGKQPNTFTGEFICAGRKLTSLEGSPRVVSGIFKCYDNKLKSLVGGPVKVGSDYTCALNKLESLEGVAEIIGRNFNCHTNKLKDLKDIHKKIKFVGCFIQCENNPIKSHVVGLLLIDGLKEVLLDNKKVQDIINKHLSTDRDVLDCIDELIEAGYPEFAQL